MSLESVKENNYNYGMALLRALMCFEVVLCHCWTTEVEVPLYLQPFSLLRGYAVPVFMCMSFFLTQKSFMKKDAGYAFNRIWKLVLPHVAWSLVYFVIYWSVGVIMNHRLVNGISDLIWQLFTGHCSQLNPTMWFQVDLIIISVLFFIIFFFFDEKIGMAIVCMGGIACLVLQYTGLNYLLFGSMRYELPLGRLFETLPMAAAGFFAARYSVLKPFKDKCYENLIVSILIGALFLVFDKTVLAVSGTFGYAGIGKIGVGLSMIMFAYNLNFGCFNYKVQNGIKFVTQYTLGIYCGHRLISFFLVNSLYVLFRLSKGGFYQCVLIYLTGFVGCLIFSKIPVNWIKNVI